MIRWMVTVLLCLGVATLGFARPCPCDHEPAEAISEEMAGDHDDCPHSAPQPAIPDEAPEGGHDCQHCDACVLGSALPSAPAHAARGTPVHADFAAIVLPPCLGNPGLPLRPPIA